MLYELSINRAGRAQRVTRDGRMYLVAPITLLVPGVLNGSQGPLYYPPDEVARDPKAWNGTPITIGHPVRNGRPVSASSPGVVAVGRVFNATADGSLRAEGWFDVEATRRADPRLLAALEAGRRVEVSTGLFTMNHPAPAGSVHNGRPYVAVARSFRPDHLAVLLDVPGACSVADGCGVNVHNGHVEPPLTPPSLFGSGRAV